MTNQQDFQTFQFSTDDGLMLSGRHYGPDIEQDTIPVVCLAGLTRNGADFHRFALLLSDLDISVVTLDSRGRGQSDRDPSPANYNVMRETQDVLILLKHLGIGKAIFVGTSRGGLLLHVLGNLAPDRIEATVLNDIGPVIEAAGLRAIAAYLGEATIHQRLEDLAAALKIRHGNEFPILDESDWHEMADAISQPTERGLEANFDPGIVAPLKDMDFSQNPPDLWDAFKALTNKPLLVIRGENSLLLSAQTVEQMLEKHPNAKALVAPGQGHAPFLHHPTITAPIIDFIVARGTESRIV
ncbi:alpha/beta fold hydrolase [Rhizobium alvei]|uniref:Alpha/beta hydrolase n=1 Tax=Rhizobium alvei TaxID=1132659 RepID=A0ABT8YIS1_9HYPH|nr:alpha/beta hydrolase [Rhizobium alvei]MDO6963586.1 alpha/beta hydrolase [Rhizobium alvei]